MLRIWACLWWSGRYRSTTSITLPNMAVRIASRSVSLDAHAHISSSDLGGFPHVEPTDSPRRSVRPSCDLGHTHQRVEAERRRRDGRAGARDLYRAVSAARPDAPMLADCTSGS